MTLEHHKKPLLSRKAFMRRLLFAIFLGAIAVVIALTIGMAGYHYIEGLSWVDAYLEAAMIFSGLGPTVSMHSTAAKIFSGTYALISAFALLLPITIILLPILHRFLHKFHIDTEE